MATNERLTLGWVTKAGAMVKAGHDALDAAVLMAHDRGISNYKIAAAYGVTESTVRARLERIKRERAQ